MQNTDNYQEKYAHLDKNHVYFGQISYGKFFSMIDNGITRYYQKIGNYTTAQGVQYNTVEGDTVNFYFDPTKLEHHEKFKLTYFNEDEIIDIDHDHTLHSQKDFLPPEPVKVCEYMKEFPYMLEVIECLFAKKKLNENLYAYYERYHDSRSDDIESGVGFTVHENKPFSEIKKYIIDELKSQSGLLYYVDYLLGKHINDSFYDKNRVLNDLKRNGDLLLWCSEEIQNDKNMVLAALTQNKHVLPYASETIRSLIGDNVDNPAKTLEVIMLNETIDSIVPPKEETIKKKLKI